MSDEPLDIITGKQVAALLRVSYRHVTGLAKRGGLPVIRVGHVLRFNRPDILAWVRDQRQKEVPSGRL
ncbi:MAG: helix-turn-helix domain-containing protein [Magnetococcales bacterium]|nr:helix-turn-helix domain-containing protein [Magnetococcales bacterium]